MFCTILLQLKLCFFNPLRICLEFKINLIFYKILKDSKNILYINAQKQYFFKYLRETSNAIIERNGKTYSVGNVIIFRIIHMHMKFWRLWFMKSK